MAEGSRRPVEGGGLREQSVTPSGRKLEAFECSGLEEARAGVCWPPEPLPTVVARTSVAAVFPQQLLGPELKVDFLHWFGAPPKWFLASIVD